MRPFRKLLTIFTRGLAFYLLFFTLLAAWYHSDVLWNTYNYGRHWDWTFFPLPDMYSQFIHRFFYAYKDNSLGYFDIISVSLIELLIKSLIYGTYQILNSLTIVTVTIPILNKIMVFMVFPMVTSLGIWALCKTTLKKLYDNNPKLFLLVAFFSNFMYTFSFLIIFDLHGGALNREISSMFFPWFFTCLFVYWKSDKTRLIDYRIVLLSLFFAIADISNMFFFGIIIVLYILFKEIELKRKISHVLTLITSIVLFNMYWLHSLVIKSATDTAAILTERKFDFNILKAYSATFTDNLFMLNTAHNLIQRLFIHNPLIYLPFFFLYLVILRNILMIKIDRKNLRLLMAIFLGYLFTTVLTNGVYSIGKVYIWFYSFDFLAFIRAAIRYMPNLAMYTVFLFLITYRERLKEKMKNLSIDYALLWAPIIVSLVLLLTNTHLITLIQTRIVKDSDFNQDVGSLYQYDPRIVELLRNDKLEYNVLPVPSWFSPIFTHNIYPKTSQGSDTDNVYLPHPVINTNGVPLFSSQLIGTFNDTEPDPYFYAITNTKYVWFKDVSVYREVNPRDYFTVDWVKGADPDNALQIKRLATQSGTYEVPDAYFLPIMYIPQRVISSNITMRHLPHMFDGTESSPAALYMINQNQTKQLRDMLKDPFNTAETVLEFKKINPTKYRIVLHNATNNVPIVLSTAFYSGWKLYAVPHTGSSVSRQALEGYSIVHGNEKNQATKEEIADFISLHLVSTLGTKSKPEFISKNITGTIQNNNLPNGSLTETWNLTTHSAIQVAEHYHLESNGFSNSWIVPVSQMCSKSSICVPQPDGSYTVELVAEFEPQRYYSISLIISLASLGLALLYVVICRFIYET